MASSPEALSLAELQLGNHPAWPEGEPCSGCVRVGLRENRVPCGVRFTSERTLRRVAGPSENGEGVTRA